MGLFESPLQEYGTNMVCTETVHHRLVSYGRNRNDPKAHILSSNTCVGSIE